MQTVKCGDYFPAEDGSRDFGNLLVVSKWIKSSNSSLILRHLEVNHKEVISYMLFLHVYITSIRQPKHINTNVAFGCHVVRG